MSGKSDIIKKFTTCAIKDIKKRKKKTVCLCGIIAEFKEHVIKKDGNFKGKKMASFYLNDGDDQIRCVMFTNSYIENCDKVAYDSPLLILGTISNKDDEIQINVSNIVNPHQAYGMEIQVAKITLEEKDAKSMREKLIEIEKVFKQRKGSTKAIINTVLKEGSLSLVDGWDYYITPSRQLEIDIEKIIGNKNTTFKYIV